MVSFPSPRSRKTGLLEQPLTADSCQWTAALRTAALQSGRRAPCEAPLGEVGPPMSRRRGGLHRLVSWDGELIGGDRSHRDRRSAPGATEESVGITRPAAGLSRAAPTRACHARGRWPFRLGRGYFARELLARHGAAPVRRSVIAGGAGAA